MWVMLAHVLSAVATSFTHLPHACSAHGWRFDHAAFVATFRSARTRAFLNHLRESQCYEVFINERLHMASQDYADIDSFEAKVALSIVQAPHICRPCVLLPGV